MDTIDYIIAGLLGFLPISEVRGGVPYAIIRSNTNTALIIGVSIAVVCNMVVPLVAIKTLDILTMLIESKHTPVFIKKIYNWILEWGRKRGRGIKTGDYVALAVFTGIPLPVTGAWTASLIAYVLGFDRKKAIIAIEIGVLLASTIVFISTYLGIEILQRIFLLE